MQEHKFEEPIDVIKKPEVVNKQYPLYVIDHRDFEKLMYSLFKNEIEFGEYKGVYDDIWLMEGVREKGKDVSLHKNGILAGVVQCKHSETQSRVGKVVVAKEIIKFLLHLIHEERTVAPNLTYYFSVSYGFDSNARELLENFNDKIFSNELEKWIRSVIKENKSLHKLAYETVKEPLYNFLKKLPVKRLDHTDITGYLNKPYNTSIIETFFSVTIVVREGPVLNKLDELNKNIQELRDEEKVTSPLEANRQFDYASVFLSNHRSEFFNLPHSHIERRETKQLFAWITNPLPGKEANENVALLSGSAGSGKSVIMKDLRVLLRQAGIPVLAIKADRFAVGTVRELEMKLNLTASIPNLLQNLSSQYETVVVLIDQIDALSQTLSSQRDAMNAYQLLIESIRSIENVRLVLSVRTFDLNYDPDLQAYKKQPVVSASLLNDEEVEQVLKKLGADAAAISPSLRTILRTPNFLNVFCKIFRPGFSSASIQTAKDLYEELWHQTLLAVENRSGFSSNTVKQCLQELAQTMNERQQIYVQHHAFSERFAKEMDYLSSAGLLIYEENTIQFFHQTFYDFVFARSFVEAGGSVENYILTNGNSLHIRSGLKMILGFLREADYATFVRLASSIIVSPKYFFHIKLLLYNLLGFIDEPTLAELDLLKKLILPHPERKQLYLETIFSEKQLRFLIENHTLERMLIQKPTLFKRIMAGKIAKRFRIEERLTRRFRYLPYEALKGANEQLCFSLLARHLPEQRAVILSFLLCVPDFNGKGAFVFRLLYFLKMWDLEEGFQLFEKYQEEGLRDRFQFYHILQDVAPIRPRWVISIYKPYLLDELEGKSQTQKLSHDSYQEGQLFEKLFAADPVAAFEFSWDFIDKYITTSSHPHPYHSKILLDHRFQTFSYDQADKEQETHFQLYTFLIETLADFLTTDPRHFNEYYQRIMQSGKLPFILLLVYAFQIPQADLQDTGNQFYAFFMDAARMGLLPLDEKMEYQLRRNLKQYFQFFSDNQKADVVEAILAIKDPYELHKHYLAGKPDFFRNHGHTVYKYLTALPREFVTTESRTKKRFSELERRYGTIQDTEPYRVRVYSVGAPLEKDAYDNMSFDHWLNCFKQYNSDDHRDRKYPGKGGLTENYRAFKEKVKEKPDHFFPFVERLFSEDIHPSYITAGLEGLKEANVSKKEFFRLYKIAIRKELGRFETLQILWLLPYLLESEIVDDEILDFVIQQALSNPDPQKDRGQPRHEAINTVRGAAVEKLTMMYFRKEWKEKIFLTLEQAADDSQVSVRVSLILRLAYLMHLDEERTFALFVKLTHSYQPDIYVASIFSAQYLINYSFERLHTYFENFINHPDGAEEIASILAVAYLKAKPGSEKLIQKAFRVNDKLRKNILHIGWTYIIDDDGNIDPRAAKLFLMGRHLTSEAILHEYSLAFLKWGPAHFVKLYPLIFKYSRSKAGKHELHYYYEYLLKCVKTEPEKCLRLISNIRSHVEPPLAKRMGEEEAISLVIGIHNQLAKLPGKKKQARRALKLFDYLLQNPTYRRNASKVTEEVER